MTLSKLAMPFSFLWILVVPCSKSVFLHTTPNPISMVSILKSSTHYKNKLLASWTSVLLLDTSFSLLFTSFFFLGRGWWWICTFYLLSSFFSFCCWHWRVDTSPKAQPRCSTTCNTCAVTTTHELFWFSCNFFFEPRRSFNFQIPGIFLAILLLLIFNTIRLLCH